ncbi:MAG: VOC family protein [Bacteroidota bacterium]
MKKTLLILTIILSSLYSNAQSFSLKFDHYTILVRDIEKSRKFYKSILQFKEKETPWGDDLPRPVIFIDIGNNQELHITEDKKEKDNIKLHKIIHFAFTVKDFDGYVKFLNKKGIEYGEWSGKNKKFQTRIDGVRQIYFQDPDGYWIEINDN